MACAQNNKSEFLIWKITPETIQMLENTGITVTEVERHGFNQLLLTW
jgi:hypothetical protein